LLQEPESMELTILVVPLAHRERKENT